MERGEVQHGVGNGLDRERLDIIVDGVDMPAPDMLAFQMLLPLLLKVILRWNTFSGIQQQSSTRTQTSSQQWQSQNGSAREMLDARDNTINK